MTPQSCWPAPLEFDAAIAAHRAWLRHLEFAIAGIEAEWIDMSSAGNPLRCPLGRWLNALPGEIHNEDLRQLMADHDHLHELLGDLAVLVGQGQAEEAEQALRDIVAPLSATLCRRLEALKHREIAPKVS